jgi:CubicO group peptidase (beta-lactamase class C family)
MRWLPVLLLLSGCTFLVRAKTYPSTDEITNSAWYKPRAPIAGQPTALPAADAGTLAPALEKAREYVSARRTTGWVVLRDGKLIDEWYAPGFSASSVTNSQSMAKTVAALLVGRAIEDRLIGSLEDPVSTWIVEWKDDKRGDITVRQLLEMASGLRLDERLVASSDLVKMHLGAHADRVALAVPAATPSGLDFEYNNVDTEILAIVLSRVYREPYPALVSERLWRPLGASDASIWLDRKGGFPKAYCCLFATARDWAKVGELILDEGKVGPTQVIPADWIRRMGMPSTHNPDYGLQLWRADEGPGSKRRTERHSPLPDRAMVWLEGRKEQRVYVLPHSRLVIVRVGEEPPDWDDSVIPNLLASTGT